MEVYPNKEGQWSNELFSEPAPIDGADITAGARESRKRHDLVDLTARNFDFHGRVQKLG